MIHFKTIHSSRKLLIELHKYGIKLAEIMKNYSNKFLFVVKLKILESFLILIFIIILIIVGKKN